MNIPATLAALTLLLLASASHAARPTSIIFDTYAETGDGVPYAQFTVRCNDGRSVPLTAWDQQRRWCVGDKNGGSCQKKQISAARAACNEAPVAHPAGAVASTYSR